MKIRKRIALTFGGAVLAACVTVGGIGAANAATPAGGQAPAQASAAASQTLTSNGSTVPAPPTSAAAAEAAVAALGTTPATGPVPFIPYNWNSSYSAWVATLTTAQKQSLLVYQKALLAKYQWAGAAAAVKVIGTNVSVIEQALGQ